MIMLAYAGVSLHTFRYTGAVMPPSAGSVHHRCRWEFSCSCKCGLDLYDHRHRWTKCDFQIRSHHFYSYILPLLVATAWPAWYTYRGYRRATVNMVGPSFFKKPKPILSKEEKIKAQEKYITELEKELNIT